MASYSYTARDTSGKLHKGIVDADGISIVREVLLDKGLAVEEIHEATLSERIAAGVESAEQKLSVKPEGSQKGKNNVVHRADSVVHKEKAPTKKKKTRSESDVLYYPIVDTLRLYAGWLLAWYLLVYAFGAYQYTRDVSYRLPYVEALLPPFSPIVLQFSFGAFLFLLLSAFHRRVHGGTFFTIALSVIGIVLFMFYRLNI